MRLLLLAILNLLLLSSCAMPLTVGDARATAVVSGCWPMGVGQPMTPTPGSAVTPVAVYPVCTPLPGTPSLTPTLTPPPPTMPPPTPVTQALLGGQQEIGQAAGYASLRSSATRTPALAVSPDGHAAMAWLVWGAGTDEHDGDVWVRVQGPSGQWGQAQTVNIQSVGSFYGGIGLVWETRERLAVVYGGGKSDDRHLYLVESTDAGHTWSDPQIIGEGKALGLMADSTGTLHCYVLDAPPGTSAVIGTAQYGSRSLTGAWAWHELPLGSEVWADGQMTILEQPTGVRRFIIVTGKHFPLSVAWSDDGATWQIQPLPTNRFISESPEARHMLAVMRRDGTSLVAAAWSQPNGPGAVAGGVYASLSFDGGQTWGAEEMIAQHEPDGSFGSLPDRGFIGGFQPTLAYDATTDQLACAWVEDDLKRYAAAMNERVVRTVLSARSLAPGAAWRQTITPHMPTTAERPQELTTWGERGWLWSNTAGTETWLVVVDERNRQARIEAELLNLSTLITEGAS